MGFRFRKTVSLGKGVESVLGVLAHKNRREHKSHSGTKSGDS